MNSDNRESDNRESDNGESDNGESDNMAALEERINSRIGALMSDNEAKINDLKSDYEAKVKDLKSDNAALKAAQKALKSENKADIRRLDYNVSVLATDNGIFRHHYWPVVRYGALESRIYECISRPHLGEKKSTIY